MTASIFAFRLMVDSQAPAYQSRGGDGDWRVLGNGGWACREVVVGATEKGQNKYGGLSTARRTMMPSVASVEMTFLFLGGRFCVEMTLSWVRRAIAKKTTLPVAGHACPNDDGPPWRTVWV